MPWQIWPFSNCPSNLLLSRPLFSYFYTPKRYQFNPEMMETTTVLHILLKALVHADGPDFELCLLLLEGPNIALLSNFLEPLTELSSLLQACQYPKFWRAVKALPRDDDEDAELGVSEAIDEHIGFADQVRMLVLESVASTFSDIPTKRLASYLDLTGACIRSPLLLSFPLTETSRGRHTQLRLCPGLDRRG